MRRRGIDMQPKFSGLKRAIFPLIFIFAGSLTEGFASDWNSKEITLDCSNDSGQSLSVNVMFSEDRNPAYPDFAMYGLISVEEYPAFLFVTKRPNKDIYGFGAAKINGSHKENVVAFIDRQTGHFEVVQLDGNSSVIDVFFVGKCDSQQSRIF